MQKDLRSYILTRIQSPLTTVEQFNWDNLRAPRICELFSPADLQELHYIATSVKLSSKTQEKISRIDKIMSNRGFVRFVSGTNRLTYRFVEDTSFLVKVAYNNKGTGDAPREFHNQMILKPFVPKIFEYTPDGVLSIQERVEPITNREEFMSVAEDVYTLITEWLLGEYVFDDIGSDYFMNYGIRKGFGVVILDFPYMFKVDYGKLICAAKDKTKTTLSGTCEGEIDYDDGFNELVCTKCGAKYSARDLAKQVEEEKVLIRPTQGGIEMYNINLNLSGGSKNANSHQVLGGTPFGTFTALKSFDFSNIITPVHVPEAEEKEEVIESAPASNVSVGVNGVIASDNKASDETPVGTPDETEDFVFDDADDSNDDDESENKQEEPKKKLENPFATYDEDDDRLKKKIEEAEEAIKNTDLNDLFSDSKAKSQVEVINNMIDKLSEKDFIEVVKHIFSKVTIENSDSSITMDTVDDEEHVIVTVIPELQIKESKTVINVTNDDSEVLSVFIPTGTVIKMINSNKLVELTEKDESYKGFVEFAAETINKKDIEQNGSDEKVFALKSDNGNYLTDKLGRIICITKIDNKNVYNVSVISNARMSIINDKVNMRKTENLKPGATAQ